MKTGAAAIAGVLFGAGLMISGMTRPDKVVGFLDITGAWDPSLAFVMGGAIAVHFVAYRLVPKMKSPIFGGTFAIPTRRDIDPRLLIGAALFGAGWALAGYCPGPALTSLVTGTADIFVFVGAMVVGMFAHQVFDRAVFPQK